MSDMAERMANLSLMDNDNDLEGAEGGAGTEPDDEGAGTRSGKVGLRLGENPYPDQPPLGTISGGSFEVFRKTQQKKAIFYALEGVGVLPLITPWTFWVDQYDAGMQGGYLFEANLRKIYTAFTVPSYWKAFDQSVPKPSSLSARSGLFLMRDERKPIWEESYNREGGCFRIRVLKEDSDKLWNDMLVCAISEQLTAFVDEDDEICGVSVSIRETEDVISIWSTQAEAAAKSKIHDFMQLLIPNVRIVAFFYKPHTSHVRFDKVPRVSSYGPSPN